MTYSSTVLADSPVGYWKLDEASGSSAADSSTNNTAATINGTVTYQTAGPSTQVPYGLTGDGSTGYVELPSLSAYLGTAQAQTWELWFYTADAISSATTARPLFGESTATSRYIYFGAVTGSLTNEVIAVSSSNGVLTGWSGFTISAGWHHLVLAFAGTQDGWTCYLDGTDVTSATIGGTKISAGSGATGFGTFTGLVGRYNTVYSSYGFSNVAVYASELSQATVRSHLGAALDDPLIFDLPGTYDWTKPGTSYTSLDAVGIGAGGGGGAGRNQTSGTAGGGGGGGAGGKEVISIPWANVPATLTIHVGHGGPGGRANFAAGAPGGDTWVVDGGTTHLSAGGGAGGAGGAGDTTAVSGGTGGAAAGGHTYTSSTEAGGAGGDGDADAAGMAGSAPAGGGGGGGDTGGTSPTDGGAGGTGGNAGALAGGTGGVWDAVTSTDPTDGTVSSDLTYRGSGGGGGSGVSLIYTNPTWATGRDGGFPGGGGGGGGGKRDSTAVAMSFLYGGVGANGSVVLELVGGSVTGTLAVTTDNSTSAASGSTVTGTLAETTDDATSAASGFAAVSGTLAVTTDDSTSSAAGSTVTGTLTATLDNATLAASGTHGIDGTLAVTTDDATLAATGTTGQVTGTLAVTTANATLVATGTITVVVWPGSSGVGIVRLVVNRNRTYAIVGSDTVPSRVLSGLSGTVTATLLDETQAPIDVTGLTVTFDVALNGINVASASCALVTPASGIVSFTWPSLDPGIYIARFTTDDDGFLSSCPLAGLEVRV